MNWGDELIAGGAAVPAGAIPAGVVPAAGGNWADQQISTGNSIPVPPRRQPVKIFAGSSPEEQAQFKAVSGFSSDEEIETARKRGLSAKEFAGLYGSGEEWAKDHNLSPDKFKQLEMGGEEAWRGYELESGLQHFGVKLQDYLKDHRQREVWERGARVDHAAFGDDVFGADLRTPLLDADAKPVADWDKQLPYQRQDFQNDKEYKAYKDSVLAHQYGSLAVATQGSDATRLAAAIPDELRPQAMQAAAEIAKREDPNGKRGYLTRGLMVFGRGIVQAAEFVPSLAYGSKTRNYGRSLQAAADAPSPLTGDSSLVNTPLWVAELLGQTYGPGKFGKAAGLAFGAEATVSGYDQAKAQGLSMQASTLSGLAQGGLTAAFFTHLPKNLAKTISPEAQRGIAGYLKNLTDTGMMLGKVNIGNAEIREFAKYAGGLTNDPEFGNAAGKAFAETLQGMPALALVLSPQLITEKGLGHVFSRKYVPGKTSAADRTVTPEVLEAAVQAISQASPQAETAPPTGPVPGPEQDQAGQPSLGQEQEPRPQGQPGPTLGGSPQNRPAAGVGETPAQPPESVTTPPDGQGSPVAGPTPGTPGAETPQAPAESPAEPPPAPPKAPTGQAQAKSQRVVQIANKAIDDLRAGLALGPLAGSDPQKVTDWVTQAGQRIASDQDAPKRLIAELLQKPRAINETETAMLGLHYRDLYNRLDQASAELIRAYDSGNETAARYQSVAVSDLLDQLADLESANGRGGTGTTWGRTGVARQILFAKDNSLEGITRRRRAAQDGKPLSAEDQVTAGKQAARIKELEEKLKAATDKDRAAADAIADQIQAFQAEKADFEQKQKLAATSEKRRGTYRSRLQRAASAASRYGVDFEQVNNTAAEMARAEAEKETEIRRQLRKLVTNSGLQPSVMDKRENRGTEEATGVDRGYKQKSSDLTSITDKVQSWEQVVNESPDLGWDRSRPEDFARQAIDLVRQNSDRLNQPLPEWTDFVEEAAARIAEEQGRRGEAPADIPASQSGFEDVFGEEPQPVKPGKPALKESRKQAQAKVQEVNQKVKDFFKKNRGVSTPSGAKPPDWMLDPKLFPLAVETVKAYLKLGTATFADFVEQARGVVGEQFDEAKEVFKKAWMQVRYGDEGAGAKPLAEKTPAGKGPPSPHQKVIDAFQKVQQYRYASIADMFAQGVTEAELRAARKAGVLSLQVSEGRGGVDTKNLIAGDEPYQYFGSVVPGRNFEQSPTQTPVQAAGARVDAAKQNLADFIAKNKGKSSLGALGSPPDWLTSPELLPLLTEAVKAYVDLGEQTFAEFLSRFKKDQGKDREADTDALRDRLREAWNAERAAGNIPPVEIDFEDQRSIPKRAKAIFKAVVETGETDREKVVDAVFEELKPIVPEITRGETEAAMSDSGEYADPKPATTDPDRIRIAQMRAELQTKVALRYAEEKKQRAPLIGKKRVDTNTADNQELKAKLGEAAKQIPETEQDAEMTRKSRQATRETALQNAIRMMEKEIADGERVAKREPMEDTPEIAALRQKKAEVKALWDTIFPKEEKEPDENKRQEAIGRGLDRAIDTLEADLKSNKLGPKDKPVDKPETAENDRKRYALKTLQDIREEFRAADPEYQRRQEQAKQETYENNLRKQLETLTAKRDTLRKGETPPPRKQPKKTTPNAAIEDLLKQRAKLNFEIRQADALVKWKNRTTTERVFDRAESLLRARFLSYLKVAGKLGGAAVQRVTLGAVEGAYGAGLAKIPGLKRLAERTKGTADWNPQAYLASVMKGLQSVRKSWERIKTGREEYDERYDPQHVSATPKNVEDLFGNIHAALHDPVKVAATEYRFEQLMRWHAKQGTPEATLKDPLFQEEVMLEAFEEGRRAIGMQDSQIARWFNEQFKAKVDPKTGHREIVQLTKSLVGAIFFPIVKIPVNLAIEGLVYQGGLLSAAAKLSGPLREKKNWNAAIDSLTPEEASVVWRHLVKGSLGAAFCALAAFDGYKGGHHLGGMYQPNKQRDEEEEPQAGGFQVGGHKLLAIAFHHPLDTAMQIWYSFGETMSSKARKKDLEPQGATAGFLSVLSSNIKEIPGVPVAESVAHLLDPQRRTRVVGDLAKSTFVPGISQELAEFTDKDSRGLIHGKPVFRRPEGGTLAQIGQGMASGVPVLRQTLVKKEPPWDFIKNKPLLLKINYYKEASPEDREEIAERLMLAYGVEKARQAKSKKPDNALSPEEWAKVQERYRGLDLQVPNQDKVLTLKKKISKENKDTKAKKALRP